TYDTVGPSLGAELIQKTFAAVALAATLILLYIAYRFKSLKFGVSAILA
ncbi:protein translocase subunit SecF, partial [Candidatus Collierbacteria bacterium CG10_big_fil_rev_8_21_14_0_10_44_9]